MVPSEPLPRDDDLEWYNDAVCDQGYDENGNYIVDVNIFFPPRDKDLYKKIASQAKEYCWGPNKSSICPVRTNCLWTAINTEKNHGIWGGLSHRERNALVRKWKKQYSKTMTLKEYIFQLDKKESNDNRKNRPS
jgi:hypothetical protein